MQLFFSSSSPSSGSLVPGAGERDVMPLGVMFSRIGLGSGACRRLRWVPGAGRFGAHICAGAEVRLPSGGVLPRGQAAVGGRGADWSTACAHGRPWCRWLGLLGEWVARWTHAGAATQRCRAATCCGDGGRQRACTLSVAPGCPFAPSRDGGSHQRGGAGAAGALQESSRERSDSRA